MNTTALLGRFEEDFLPAIGTLCGGCEKRLVASCGGEGNDAGHAEFSGFFEGPFEGVELHDGKKQGGFELRDEARELFDEGKVDLVAGHGFDAAQPDGGAITKFVKLTGLRAEDAAEMVRGLALHGGMLIVEVLDEETASHG